MIELSDCHLATNSVLLLAQQQPPPLLLLLLTCCFCYFCTALTTRMNGHAVVGAGSLSG